MAKDRKKLQHIHSSVADKQPTPQSLEVGEIAVNNYKDQEFLSTKNTDDKVVRFSSDSQVVNWMERKEVMPYVGYVRGAAGPSATSGDTPSADNYGSYGIQPSDLLDNTSEIIIKLNQVAASATTKHDKVNGKKDKYLKEINPTIDGGINDGAGFFIDMSRYAMQDANPQFSGITNTCYSVLNGRTEILGGTGTAGDCRSLLNIDVLSATTKASSAWTSASTAVTVIGSNDTTISGNTTLKVSGTTTEYKKNVVTENNLSAKTENTTGVKTENNSSAYTVNTTGDTSFNTTGTTTIKSTGSGSDVIIYAKDDLCATSDDVAALKGAVITNVGSDCNNTNQTQTLNVKANTADTRVTSAYTSATTATTIIGTSNTSATTADYSGNTLNSHIKSWTHSGDTLSITELSETTIKAPRTTISGSTLDVKENNTTISSCTKIDLITNDLNVHQCDGGGSGSADFKFCSGFTIESNNITLKECDNNSGKTIIKSNATDISGKTLTIRESGATDFSGATLTTKTTGNTSINATGNIYTNGDYIYTNAVHSTCIVSDYYTYMEGKKGTYIGYNCAGGVVESPNTIISSTLETSLESEKYTNISALSGVSIWSSSSVTVTAGDDFCVDADDSARLYGKGSTYVGVKCDGTPASATTVIGDTIKIMGDSTNISGATNVNISGGTITEKSPGNIIIETTGNGSDVCISAADSARFYGGGSTYVGVNCDGTIGPDTIVKGTTVEISGNTTNISGTTKLNLSGNTVNIDGSTINIDSSGNACIEAHDTLNLGGYNEVKIGYDCGGNPITKNIDIRADKKIDIYSTGFTLNSDLISIFGYTDISGTTKINGNTTILSALTVSGDTYLDGALHLTTGLNKPLNWVYGDVCNHASGTTKFAESSTDASRTITIPSKVGDLKRQTLSWSYGSVIGASNSSYDPGANSTNACTANTSFIIPKTPADIGGDNSLTWTYDNVCDKSGDSYKPSQTGKIITIPKTISHVTCGDIVDNSPGTQGPDAPCVEINKPLCVSGTITSSGVIYSSDRTLKDNIMEIGDSDIEKAKNIVFKSFTFRDDAEQRKTYGVIAQEVQETGLNELVHQKEDGKLGVDYISLLILKNAYLENMVKNLAEKIERLENK